MRRITISNTAQFKKKNFFLKLFWNPCFPLRETCLFGVVRSAFMYPTGCLSPLLGAAVPSSFPSGIWFMVEASVSSWPWGLVPWFGRYPVGLCWAQLRATGLSHPWRSPCASGPILFPGRFPWFVLLKSGVPFPPPAGSFPAVWSLMRTPSPSGAIIALLALLCPAWESAVLVAFFTLC